MSQTSACSENAYVMAELREMARRAQRLSVIASSEDDRQRLCLLTGALEARAATFEGHPDPMARSGNNLLQFWRRVVG